MEVTEIKAKVPSSIAPDSNQEISKKSKRANTAKAEARSSKEIPRADEEAIQKLTEHINQMMKQLDFSLQFIPDKEAGEVIIRVLDGEGRVIRQIPPHEVINLSSNIGEQVGLLLNEKL